MPTSKNPPSREREQHSTDRRSFLRKSSTGWIAAAAGMSIGAAAPGGPQPQTADPPSGFADVRNFGASGDGTTDDTEAFQEAVASATGGLWIPRGDYRVTAPVEIDLTSVGPMSVRSDGTGTVMMDGAGPAFHIIGSHDGTANPSTVSQQTWNRERMPIVDGIEIVGQHPEAVGIRLEQTMQAIVTRCSVRQALHGIHLFQRNRNVIIGDCHLYENTGVGIYLDRVNLHQINITGTHVSYNGGGGIVCRGSEVRNLHIGTCDLEANMSANGSPTANILLDTREGRVREGAVVGCTIQHTREGPATANIRMIGTQVDPPTSAGRFAISDNSMSDADYNIHLTHARGVTITGNIFWVSQQHSVLAEDCMHLLMSTNTLENNPDYSTDVHRNVVLRDCRDCTVDNMHIQGTTETDGGIVLERCEGINVTGCQLLDCETAGVSATDTSHSRISDCIFRSTASDTPVIRLAGGSNNQITDNIVRGTVDIEEGTAAMTNNLMAG